MEDHYIFDVPVYLCRRDEYEHDMSKKEKEHFQDLYKLRQFCDIYDDMSREDTEREKHSARSSLGGPWYFNQIVGWIRLYADVNYIGGHIWWVSANQLRRRMKYKTFYQNTFGNIFSTSALGENADSETIYCETLRAIKDYWVDSHLLKNRFVDLELFVNIGPFINWRKLLDSRRDQQAS